MTEDVAEISSRGCLDFRVSPNSLKKITRQIAESPACWANNRAGIPKNCSEGYTIQQFNSSCIRSAERLPAISSDPEHEVQRKNRQGCGLWPSSRKLTEQLRCSSEQLRCSSEQPRCSSHLHRCSSDPPRSSPHFRRLHDYGADGSALLLAPRVPRNRRFALKPPVRHDLAAITSPKNAFYILTGGRSNPTARARSGWGV